MEGVASAAEKEKEREENIKRKAEALRTSAADPGDNAPASSERPKKKRKKKPQYDEEVDGVRWRLIQGV